MRLTKNSANAGAVNAETCNLTDIFIGLITFLIIGVFHPLAIKGEYNLALNAVGFFLFLGIGKLFEQQKHVEKG